MNIIKEVQKYAKKNLKNSVRVYLEELDEDKFIRCDDENLMAWYNSLNTKEAELRSYALAIKRVINEQSSLINNITNKYPDQEEVLTKAKSDLLLMKKLTIDQFL